jgi:hypothetical protein
MAANRRGSVIHALLLVLLLGAVLALQTGGASAISHRCAVELRVDVFGVTSPGSHWGLNGGLNAGKHAILRARQKGCARLDHITGRWRSGGLNRPNPFTWCARRVCFLNVTSPSSAAADFQAYARTGSGGLVGSNMVRVAWAGPGLNGYYDTFDGAGSRTSSRGGHVEITGATTISVTNQNNQIARGTYNPSTLRISLRSGWPDTLPGRPFVGQGRVIGGKVRIDWGPRVSATGAPSGGFWVHT